MSTTQFKDSVSWHVRQQCTEMGKLSGERWEESFVQHCLQQLQSHRGFRRYLFYFSCSPSFLPYAFSLQCQGKAHWHRSYISKAARYFLKFILLIWTIFKVLFSLKFEPLTLTLKRSFLYCWGQEMSFTLINFCSRNLSSKEKRLQYY